MAKKRFKTLALPRKRSGQRVGEADKKRKFQEMGSEKLSYKQSLAKRGKIYVFWKKRKCLTLGGPVAVALARANTSNGDGSIGTTRIDVYLTHQRKSTRCWSVLAIHRFRPTKNKVKAATENWTPKCPLCAFHRKIKTELRKIYRFR